MKLSRVIVCVLAVPACGTSLPSEPSLIAGFNPPAAKPGYERMIAPVVPGVTAGSDLNLCQWLEAPAKIDRQVIDLAAYQSRGGHHLVLYATSEPEPIGESHICTTDDMLAVNFLGATESGGEGADDVHLPDGFAFDLPKGMYLMANTHYVNSSDDTYDVQSVVDVKYADPKHPLAPVGFIAVNWDQFDIPAGQNVVSDAYCTAPEQLSFFLWGDHMHQLGSGEYSEIIRHDGTKTMMASDPVWTPELTYSTPWVHWDPATPFVVNSGDTFHLHCEWSNTSGTDVKFPTEMCVGTGMVLEGMPQAVCEASAMLPAT
jgi:hypothetical protein